KEAPMTTELSERAMAEAWKLLPRLRHYDSRFIETADVAAIAQALADARAEGRREGVEAAAETCRAGERPSHPARAEGAAGMTTCPTCGDSETPGQVYVTVWTPTQIAPHPDLEIDPERWPKFG